MAINMLNCIRFLSKNEKHKNMFGCVWNMQFHTGCQESYISQWLHRNLFISKPDIAKDT